MEFWSEIHHFIHDESPGLRAQVTQIWRLLDANGVKVPKGTGEVVLKELLFMDIGPIGVSINGGFHKWCINLHKWWINGFPSDKPPFGISINILFLEGTQIAGWFVMENPTEMDDLGVPLFLGHRHINGKMHIHKLFFVHFWAGIKDSPSVYQGSSWSIMVLMMVYHGLEHHVLYEKHGHMTFLSLRHHHHFAAGTVAISWVFFLVNTTAKGCLKGKTWWKHVNWYL